MSSVPRKEIVAGVLGVPPDALQIALRPPQTFQSNRLYDVWVPGRRLILKEYLKPAEFHEAPVREFEALQRLAALDVAPQPCFWRPHSAHENPFVVYEFMEGQMWDRCCPSPQELRALAQLWLTVHEISGPDLWRSRGYERTLSQQAVRFQALFRRYGDWAEAHFAPARQAAQRCLSLLAARRDVIQQLDEERPPLCFCRSDARFANVIARPDGRLGMVDWEDSGLRDAARDVADLLTHANQEDLVSEERWQAFLQPYVQGQGGKDPGLVRRTHLYLGIYPLFWLWVLIADGLERAGRGQLAGWMVHGTPANQKMQRYLARGLAWPDSDLSPWLQRVAGVRFFPE